MTPPTLDSIWFALRLIKVTAVEVAVAVRDGGDVGGQRQ